MIEIKPIRRTIPTRVLLVQPCMLYPSINYGFQFQYIMTEMKGISDRINRYSNNSLAQKNVQMLYNLFKKMHPDLFSGQK